MFPKKSVWGADEDEWNRQEMGSTSSSPLGPVETPFDLIQPDFSKKSPLTGHRLSWLHKDMYITVNWAWLQWAQIPLFYVESVDFSCLSGSVWSSGSFGDWSVQPGSSMYDLWWIACRSLPPSPRTQPSNSRVSPCHGKGICLKKPVETQNTGTGQCWGETFRLHPVTLLVISIQATDRCQSSKTYPAAGKSQGIRKTDLTKDCQLGDN